MASGDTNRRASDGCPLLERRTELDRLRDLAREAVAGRGGCVAISGSPGIGKTTIANAAAETGRAAGMVVTRAIGGVLERDHPFAGARDLLVPLVVQVPVESRAMLFAGAAGRAARVLGLAGAAPAGSGSEDPGSILHGLYWLVANLAERWPLLLIADDAQWLDGPTLRLLAYLARRLDGLRVALLVASRPSEPGPEGILLAALLADPAVELLNPAPLSPTAVASLVRQRLTGDADDDFCRACADAAGGNPFLTLELIRALREAEVQPERVSVSEVTHIGGRRAGKVILRRLHGLPETAAELARAVAVLGKDAELQLAAQLAGLNIDDAAEAADLLTRSDLLVAERPLRFFHPVVQAAVYDSIGAGRRSRAHARAAQLIHGQGAELVHVASHLLAAEPAADGWAAEVLLSAGRAALAQGAPDTAARFLARALDEPPPSESRVGVLAELGLAERAVNRPSAADHLQEALALATDPSSRVEIAVLLGGALAGLRRAREAVLIMQAVRSGIDDAALRARLEARIAVIAFQASDAAPCAAADIESVCGRIERGEDLPADAAVFGAVVAALRNRPSEPLGRLTADAVARHQSGAATQLPLWCASAQWTLIMCEHHESAAASEWLIDQARRQGESYLLGILMANKAFAAVRQGDLTGAEADARIAVEIDVLCDAPHQLAEGVAGLIEVLVHRDEAAAAAALLAEHGLDGPIDPRPTGPEFIVRARGLLRLAQGRTIDAIADLRAAGERCMARGILAPAHLPWRSDLATALAAAGRRDDAVELAAEEVDLARTFGAPRTLGNALRCLGALSGAEGTLLEAARLQKHANCNLGLGQTLVELGALHRRRNSRSEARAVLAQGLDLATRCGATVLAASARAEMGLAGGRPRRTAVSGRDSLTAAELRAAALAAQGRTNKEIAQAMFVSLKTIETQLGAAYRKLEVTSRRDLAKALSESDADDVTAGY